ncbi:MAG: ATP-dependent helicase, partial [Brucella intermedia]
GREIVDPAEQPQPVIETSDRRDAIRASNDERRGKPQHEQKRRRDRDDDGPSPVGFGNDIPAFMLIPTGI